MENRDELHWKTSLLWGGRTTAGGQLHKSNSRSKDMGFEVVMVMRAYDPNSVWAINPTHAAARLLTPHLSSHLLRCSSCIEVKWTRTFIISIITPSHYAVTGAFFSFTHTQTMVQGSDTGQEVNVYVDEAPLPALPSWATVPSVFLNSTIPQKHRLWRWFSMKALFLFTSLLLLLTLSLLNASLLFSFSLLLLAGENNGVLLLDFTFLGTFTLVFSPDDPINVFTFGFSTGSTGLQFCSRSLVK